MSKFELSPVNSIFSKQVLTLTQKVENPAFVAGVSGGPDSMALLYLLHRHGFSPLVVHCNYGMRGEQSDKDQTLVEQVCMMWNMECVSVKLDYEEKGGGNFQEWARKERYRIFRELKSEYRAQYILTAHHQDDQIETIFQKILRGSGITAFTGIPVLEEDLFRPLLDASKSQILDFVQEFNIPYRIDASNEESTYARNFLRNRWFPMLEEMFPGWRTNLLSLPEKAAAYRELVKYAAGNISNNRRSFKRNAFHSLDNSLKPVLFKELFERFSENDPIKKGFLENIQQIHGLQTGQSVDITENYKLHRDRDLYYFIHKEGNADTKQKFTLFRDDLNKGFRLNHVQFTVEPAPEATGNATTLNLDADKLEYPITIRNWKDGDQIRPLGMKEGRQLVSDHLTNRKVPSHRKKEALVLESFDEMIAAVIFPPEKQRLQPGTISESVRISKSTQKIIKIEIIH